MTITEAGCHRHPAPVFPVPAVGSGPRGVWTRDARGDPEPAPLRSLASRPAPAPVSHPTHHEHVAV